MVCEPLTLQASALCVCVCVCVCVVPLLIGAECVCILRGNVNSHLGANSVI